MLTFRTEKIRIAIIGAGMVTESIHLPVLAKFSQIDVVAIVDKHEKRARELAALYGIRRQETDHKAIIDRVDAAIIAVPHHLHAPITLDFLNERKHVLVEKPMALRSIDCDKIIEKAEEVHAVVSVGHVRRLYKPFQKVKYLIERRKLGDVIGFDFAEGRIFDWPVKTFDTFDPALGGGVLTDVGSHVLDLVLWWFGDVEEYTYTDDSEGGAEANCEIFVTMKSGVRGSIRLSRTCALRNTYKIFFRKGMVEVGVGHDAVLRICRSDNGYVGELNFSHKSKMKILDYFHLQMKNFLRKIQHPRVAVTNMVDAAEAARVVRFIESCKGARTPLKYPWELSEI